LIKGKTLSHLDFIKNGELPKCHNNILIQLNSEAVGEKFVKLLKKIMKKIMKKMNIDNLWGPYAPELNWVPAPRYLLRRDRILRLMKKHVSLESLLEIGPGSGALLIEFSKMDFECEVLETSSKARILLNKMVQKYQTPVIVHSKEGENWESKFDIICAFDVLEHIKDDTETVHQWTNWLKPGKFLYLSVPAHMSRWNASDEWAGHYRRYEKDKLFALLNNNGLEVKFMECYGFPIANITEFISSWIRKKSIKQGTSTTDSRKIRTDKSGIDRKLETYAFSFLNTLPGRMLIYIFLQLQRPFISLNWGNGYLVKAVKSTL